MGGALGCGRCGGGPRLDKVGRSGVQVLLNRMEAAGDQLQTVRRVRAGSSRLAGDPVSGVLDQSADRGQRASLLVGELREDAGELRRCGRDRTGNGPLRGAGADGDQVQVLLDAARFTGKALPDVGGRGAPGAVEVDQVGEQIKTSGLALDSDPPPTVLRGAGYLDTSGPCEPVGSFGPLGTCQLPVVRVEPDVEMEDRMPVVVRAGSERMLQVGIFEVLGPLNGRPGLLLVVRGVVVQARSVGDHGVLRQALVRGKGPPERLGQRFARRVGPRVQAGDHDGTPLDVRVGDRC